MQQSNNPQHGKSPTPDIIKNGAAAINDPGDEVPPLARENVGLAEANAARCIAHGHVR